MLNVRKKNGRIKMLLNELKQLLTFPTVPRKPRTEIGKVELCLDYCYHRLAKHDNCGIKDLITVEDVNVLRAKCKQGGWK